jgi:REP element-mobilizing transposase RayT
MFHPAIINQLKIKISQITTNHSKVSFYGIIPLIQKMDFHYRVINNKSPHFITISVVDKIPLFKTEDYRDCVIRSLEFCQRVKTLKLHGWCLMPDKLYLIVTTGDNRKISDVIRDFKNFTNKIIIKRIKEVPSEENRELLKKFKKTGVKNRKNIEYKIWEDGYYPDELFSHDYIVKKLNYIHFEPVEHKIVCKMWEYDFSSAKNYMDQDGILEIVKF